MSFMKIEVFVSWVIKFRFLDKFHSFSALSISMILLFQFNFIDCLGSPVVPYTVAVLDILGSITGSEKCLHDVWVFLCVIYMY